MRILDAILRADYGRHLRWRYILPAVALALASVVTDWVLPESSSVPDYLGLAALVIIVPLAARAVWREHRPRRRTEES